MATIQVFTRGITCCDCVLARNAEAPSRMTAEFRRSGPGRRTNGVLLACKVFAYEIKLLRKAGAAVCFALLNTIPIPIPLPFINVLIGAVGMYVCLMDDSYNRSAVNKVFGLTFVFAFLATMGLYYLNT